MEALPLTLLIYDDFVIQNAPAPMWQILETADRCKTFKVMVIENKLVELRSNIIIHQIYKITDIYVNIAY